MRENPKNFTDGPWIEDRGPKKGAFETVSLKPQLTPAQAAARAELASRVLSKRRLLPFIQRLNPRYKAGWVHEDICRRLEKFSEDVAAEKSPRLMILMPPRHGKSEIASRMYPAWHLGRYPDHEFIACSYNIALTMSFSRKVKEAITDPSYGSVFATQLKADQQSVEEWGIAEARGGYVAAGVGGGITGKGAHILLIDDPIKNAEEADSADTREKLWDWYGSTAYTRLAPGGGVLVIQTWWHDDDLAGRLQIAMKENADDPDVDKFVIVKYPAMAEADEYLDHDTDLIVYDEAPANGRLLRLKGEALHAERYDIDKLRKIKKTLPTRWWSSLYQQNPVPDDGGYFTKDQFRQRELPPLRKTHPLVAVDFAITEKKINDYTVITAGLQDDDDVLHIADMVRFKSGDAHFIVDAILNACNRWYTPGLVLGVEDGQIWKTLDAVFKKRMLERVKMGTLAGYVSVMPLKPLTDKMVRARPLQARMQQGLVSFAKGVEWYETARMELLRFPAGVHDDIVDSLAWMAQLAVGMQPPRKPKGEQLRSWKDRLGRLGAENAGSWLTA